MNGRTHQRAQALGVLALVGLAFSLAGCSGADKLDGEYYSERNQVIVDGDMVTIHELKCADDDGGPSYVDDSRVFGQGKLNDDRTQVMWASDDEHIELDAISGQTPISKTEANEGEVLRIGEYEFKPMSEDEGLETHKTARCS